VFIGLGLTLLQGYGMTESSPVVSVNRPEDNLPASIGVAMPGIEVRVGEHDELLTRSPSVMLGYWNNEEATEAAFTEDGWLRSGDKARIDEKGHIFITGRIKEIIVLANGEKVPPADMEMAITLDPLFEQVMVFGEGRAFLSAIAVLSEELWYEVARVLDVEADDPSVLNDRKVEKFLQRRMAQQLRNFPGYAQVRRLVVSLRPWTVDDGLLTPTMKMKRAQIMERFEDEIENLYEGRTG
jgi:long-chain acyl-CoA synthetase